MSDTSGLILSLPGPWTNAEELAVELAATGAELRDGQLILKGAHVGTAWVEAMSSAILEDLLTASQGRLTEADRIALSTAAGIAVLGVRCDSPDHARMVMAIGALLASRGAVAVLVDPPHKAHRADDWCHLLEELEQGSKDSFYFAFVRMFKTTGSYVTCGMGVLGLRDFTISRDVPSDEAFRILDQLAQWWIVEDPDLKRGSIIGDGRGGFLILQPEACAHYEPDTLEYNPAGVWKLVPIAGSKT